MSATDKDQTPRLELDIFGQQFRLRAPEEDHARLKRAARHVDSVMRELMVSQTTTDTVRLAMQAALVITVDYYKYMDDATARSGTADENKRRVDSLIQKLEESLKSL